jgi:molybdopterin biosynthesis enzyme
MHLSGYPCSCMDMTRFIVSPLLRRGRGNSSMLSDDVIALVRFLILKWY